MIYLWTRPEINTPDFYHHACLLELAQAFQVEPRNAGKLPEDSGVHVLMVPCRWLFDHQNWFRGLKGPRVIVEHDAYLNFMPDSPWYRCYTRFYRATNFDLLIASGKQTAHRLREEGIPAAWVPKGCAREHTRVVNRRSGRIGCFGKPILEQEVGKPVHFYESRHEMMARMGDYPLISSTVPEFTSVVPAFSGGVQNDASMGEPMAKHFEASAMGCAVIRDRQDELVELGYRNHESMVVYEDWDEMREMVDFYGKPRHRHLLRGIQERGAEVARENTWAHRARQVFNHVKPYLRDRIF